MNLAEAIARKEPLGTNIGQAAEIHGVRKNFLSRENATHRF